MGSILYKWDDVGAPTLIGGQAGSLLPILKACLVTGYGTGVDEKLPAGWTQEFEDAPANKLVLRLGGGTRQYVRFHDGARTSYANTCDVRGYTTMSSVDSGIQPLPPFTEATYNCIVKSYANNRTEHIQWWIIADDSGFWFLYKPYSNIVTPPVDSFYVRMMAAPVYVGDFVPIREKLKNKFCAFLANSSQVMTSAFYPYTTTSANPAFHGYDVSDNEYVLETSPIKFAIATGSGSTETNQFGVGKYLEDFHGTIGEWVYAYPEVFQPGSPTAKYIGRLPGLKAPLASIPNSLNFVDMVEFYEYTDGEISGFVFQTYTGNMQLTVTNAQIVYIGIGEGFRHVL